MIRLDNCSMRTEMFVETVSGGGVTWQGAARVELSPNGPDTPTGADRDCQTHTSTQVMADQVTIYEATLACHRVFRDSAAVPTLQEWAENRLADLNLWASGAGALKVGKASLDARLSSNPDAKIFVVNLLGMLQAFVERCVETGTVESSHLAERTRNDFFLGTDGHTDTLDQAMQDVKSIIGQLSRITTSIRKAGTNARIQKADASYDPDHPQVKALRIHLQLLLLSRPTNNGTLRVLISSHGVVLTSPVDETIVTDSRSLTVIQQRLIEANLKRRNRFLYAQRHAIKLSDEDPTVSTSIQTPQKAPLPPGANPFARSTEEPELPKVYSTTTATDVQDPIQLPTRSSAQPTTTVISEISSRVTYPKPPPLRSAQNIFQCLCCCQTLPASVGRGSQWKYVLILSASDLQLIKSNLENISLEIFFPTHVF